MSEVGKTFVGRVVKKEINHMSVIAKLFDDFNPTDIGAKTNLF